MTRHLFRVRLVRALALTAMLTSSTCWAAPERVVIARHAEKLDTWRLCTIGEARARALSETYLALDNVRAIFQQPPAAIMTISLHTSETAEPTAHALALPLTNYVVLPGLNTGHPQLEVNENRQTRLAVQDLMTDTRYAGKQVLMIWEHFHIASAALEGRFRSEKVTLRQLLGLDKAPFAEQVPETWPDDTYNFFWIVDFYPDGRVKDFRTLRQHYGAPYAHLPDNDWGAPSNLPPDARCL